MSNVVHLILYSIGHTFQWSIFGLLWADYWIESQGTHVYSSVLIDLFLCFAIVRLCLIGQSGGILPVLQSHLSDARLEKQIVTSLLCLMEKV